MSARPNPSLERTSTGLALGPRAGQCHHPSRGPSAKPVEVRSAQTLGVTRHIFAMPTLNSKQTTAMAVALAVGATFIAVHNPTEGFDFTEQHFGGEERFKEEWQFSRAGCSKEAEAEMFRLKHEIDESNMSDMEKSAAKMTGRPAQIFRQCVEVTSSRNLIRTESQPLWVWNSRGALHPALSSVKSLLVVLALTVLWAGVAMFALRGKGNPGK